MLAHFPYVWILLGVAGGSDELRMQALHQILSPDGEAAATPRGGARGQGEVPSRGPSPSGGTRGPRKSAWPVLQRQLAQRGRARPVLQRRLTQRRCARAEVLRAYCCSGGSAAGERLQRTREGAAAPAREVSATLGFYLGD